MNEPSEDRPAPAVSADPTPGVGPSGDRLQVRWALAALVALTLALTLVGIDWGLPNERSWSVDSIGGRTSLTQYPRLADHWKHRYPPMQFFLSAPFLAALDSMYPGSGYYSYGSREAGEPETLHKLSAAMLLARFLSVLMGVGTVIAVFLSGRELFEDWRAGLLAGLTVVTSQLWVFHARVSNLDVPMVFWFSLALWVGILAAKKGRTRDFVLLGLFAALAMSTKEPAAGFLVGLALAVIVGRFLEESKIGGGSKAGLMALCKGPVWFALASFVVAMLLFSVGLGGGWAPYLERLGYWAKDADDPADAYKAGRLLRRAGEQFVMVMAPPLTLLAVVSVVVVVARRWKESLFVVLPPLTFFLLIVLPVSFIRARFALPALPSIGLAIGGAGVLWLNLARRLGWTRWVPHALIFGLSLVYCLGLVQEFLRDSRYLAETWLEENAIPGEHVAILGERGPRPYWTGMSYSMRSRWRRATDLKRFEESPPYPKFVVVTRAMLPPGMPPWLRRAMNSGRAGYEIAATFGSKDNDPTSISRWLPDSGWIRGYRVSEGATIYVRTVSVEEARRRLRRASPENRVEGEKQRPARRRERRSKSFTE